MTLTDEMNLLATELDERKDFFSGIENIKMMSSMLMKITQKFEYIKNKGSFATIPDDIKVVLLRWEAAFQVCKQSLMDDPEITELFQWEK